MKFFGGTDRQWMRLPLVAYGCQRVNQTVEFRVNMTIELWEKDEGDYNWRPGQGPGSDDYLGRFSVSDVNKSQRYRSIRGREQGITVKYRVY